MTPPKVVCPICGSNMSIGQRVQISFAWEKGERTRRETYAVIVCRECAKKVSKVVKVERPRDV